MSEERKGMEGIVLIDDIIGGFAVIERDRQPMQQTLLWVGGSSDSIALSKWSSVFIKTQ